MAKEERVEAARAGLEDQQKQRFKQSERSRLGEAFDDFMGITFMGTAPQVGKAITPSPEITLKPGPAVADPLAGSMQEQAKASQRAVAEKIVAEPGEVGAPLRGKMKRPPLTNLEAAEQLVRQKMPHAFEAEDPYSQKRFPDRYQRRPPGEYKLGFNRMDPTYYAKGEGVPKAEKIAVQNTRLANHASRMIKPIAATGLAAQIAGGLQALMVAGTMSGPLQFLFGKGPGSYSETQDPLEQFKTLSRLAKRPLNAKDLNPQALEKLKGEEDFSSELFQGGYLSHSLMSELQK